MHSKEGPHDEQARVSQKGAGWIAENLLGKLTFWIRSSGTIKELNVRLKQDGQVFPLEWFRDFHVRLWLADNVATDCDVDVVKEIKRKWFSLILTPSSDHDRELWADVREDNICRIELVTDEERLLFVWREELRLFLREEVH